LRAELLADFAEGEVRVFLHDLGASLLGEVHVRRKRLLGRVRVLDCTEKAEKVGYGTRDKVRKKE